MNPNNHYNEPSRDPRRAHLRVDTGSTQQVNGNASEDSPQQPSQASPASTAMSTDSAVGIRIRGQGKPTGSRDDSKAFDQFATHVASYSTASLRKEQMSKKTRARTTELRKTEERSSQFPSFVNQCQRAHKATTDELATVDKKLQEHLKVRNELVQAISGGVSSSIHQEELDSMRSELEKTKLEMKEEIAKAREEATQARNESEQMKLEIQRVDRTVSDAHDSRISAVEAVICRVGQQQSSADHRVSDLSKSTDETKAIFRSLKDEIESFKSEAQSKHVDLKQQLDSFQSKIDSNQELSASISKINGILGQHQSLLNNLKDELRDFQTTNTSAAGKINEKDSGSLNAITDDIQNLSQQINDLWKYLEAKDEEVAKDSDLNGQAIDSVNVELKNVRAAIDECVKLSTDRNSSRQLASQFDQSVTPLKQEMEQHSKLLTTNCHAIQSLELRYNNLTTEPLVQAMVREMQVQYPYASATQEAIERIKGQLGELSQKYVSDTDGLNNRVTELSRGMQIMRNEQNGFQSGVAEKQTKSIDAIAEQVQTVAESSRETTSQLEALQEAQATSEKERKNMVQAMNHERDRITEKIASMETTGVDKEYRDELSSKLNEISTRLEDVETTTAIEVGKFGGQVKALEKAFLEGLDTTQPSIERSSESSGEIPLAIASRKDPKPGEPSSKPPLLSPNKPKMSMGNLMPLKRKTPGSSSSTPQISSSNQPSLDRSNERGLSIVHKSKKLKDKH